MTDNMYAVASWERSLGRLRGNAKGWIDKETEAPSKLSVSRAESLIRDAIKAGAPEPNIIMPDIDGGVLVTWSTNDGWEMELEVGNNRGFHLYTLAGPGSDAKESSFHDGDIGRVQEDVRRFFQDRVKAERIGHEVQHDKA